MRITYVIMKLFLQFSDILPYNSVIQYLLPVNLPLSQGICSSPHSDVQIQFLNTKRQCQYLGYNRNSIAVE